MKFNHSASAVQVRRTTERGSAESRSGNRPDSPNMTPPNHPRIALRPCPRSPARSALPPIPMSDVRTAASATRPPRDGYVFNRSDQKGVSHAGLPQQLVVELVGPLEGPVDRRIGLLAMLAAIQKAQPSDFGSDALVSNEAEEPLWGRKIWHGRRKTGCDGRDLLRRGLEAL
jgi:hypothetical protein